jgi:hypothetical protein
MSVDGQPYRHVSPFHQRSLEALPIIPFCSPIYDANLRLLEGPFVLFMCTLPPRQRRFSHTLFGTVVLK